MPTPFVPNFDPNQPFETQYENYGFQLDQYGSDWPNEGIVRFNSGYYPLTCLSDHSFAIYRAIVLSVSSGVIA